MADNVQASSGGSAGPPKKSSELARLRKRVEELEIQLETANQRAFEWAKYSAASTVTISKIKRSIPANYRKQGFLLAETSRQILSHIDNQPDQLTASKLIFNAVLHRLINRLESRIKSQSGPSSPRELQQWLTSQVEEW